MQISWSWHDVCVHNMWVDRMPRMARRTAMRAYVGYTVTRTVAHGETYRRTSSVKLREGEVERERESKQTNNLTKQRSNQLTSHNIILMGQTKQACRPMRSKQWRMHGNATTDHPRPRTWEGRQDQRRLKTTHCSITCVHYVYIYIYIHIYTPTIYIYIYIHTHVSTDLHVTYIYIYIYIYTHIRRHLGSAHEGGPEVEPRAPGRGPPAGRPHRGGPESVSKYLTYDIYIYIYILLHCFII